MQKEEPKPVTQPGTLLDETLMRQSERVTELERRVQQLEMIARAKRLLPPESYEQA